MSASHNKEDENERRKKANTCGIYIIQHTYMMISMFVLAYTYIHAQVKKIKNVIRQYGMKDSIKLYLQFYI